MNRFGEKLFEEPLISSESTLETVHPKVKVCQAREVSAEFCESLKLLQEMKPFHQRELALDLMQGMVPEYRPDQESLETKNIH